MFLVTNENMGLCLYMTTDLEPVRATSKKKKKLICQFDSPAKSKTLQLLIFHVKAVQHS